MAEGGGVKVEEKREELLERDREEEAWQREVELRQRGRGGGSMRGWRVN